MAIEEKKDKAASVLARLKNQSKETGIAYQNCLQLFAQEEFLRKLERSDYSSNFILKGGMFLYTLTRFSGRPTMDIDFMIRSISNDMLKMKEIIQDICSVDTSNDYISIEVLGTKEITPEKEYPGVGINLLGHIKNVRIPFSIDIGVDDVIVPDAEKRHVATRLNGFDEPCVYTYSLESTLAEKFDAIIKRMTATSRMKDFYDLYYIPQSFDFEGEYLLSACKSTLHHRGTPFEKDYLDKIVHFDENQALVELWENYDPGAGLDKPSFRVILDQLDLFFRPIFLAICNDEKFEGSWSAKLNSWEDNTEK